MKIKIAAAKLNERGCVAILENSNGDSIDVFRMNQSQDAESLCLEAARILRDLADKFNALAVSDGPFKEKTHNAVNKFKTDNSKA